MRKSIQVMARSFCTNTKSNIAESKNPQDLINNRKPTVAIPVRHFEFEPFKFSIERQNLIYGYTMEEIYGRYHGLKHSNSIKKEISKDSLFITLLIVVNLFLVFECATRDTEEQKDWLNYYYSEMNDKRNNISL